MIDRESLLHKHRLTRFPAWALGHFFSCIFSTAVPRKCTHAEDTIWSLTGIALLRGRMKTHENLGLS